MAGRIPDGVIDEISRRADIVEVVGSYVSLTRRGDRWWGLCPFHSEKSPSFSVSPESNLFYCFGCHKGGGIFQFLMDIDSLSFPEAVSQLADRVGVEVHLTGTADGQADSRKAMEELYARVSGVFRWLLLNHPDAAHARKYLVDRAIHEDTSELYHIGWAPADGEWLYNFLHRKNYSDGFLSESGLFSRRNPHWSYFVDRLMFPVMPDGDRVVAFSGRALSDHGPKYINSPETRIYRKSQQLYGLAQARSEIRSSRVLHLCEGNMDVLSCYQAGIRSTVAPLGTAFTVEQARIAKRMADTVVLMFDNDAAGRKATVKAAIVAENSGLNVMTVSFPEGSDPADVLLNEGPDTLKKNVQRPINIFDYLLDFLTGVRSSRSGESQEEILRELTPYLASVGSEVRRDAYLRELAGKIGADPMTVIREFRTRKEFGDVSIIRTADASEKAGDDLFLMAAVAVNTEYFEDLRNELVPELLRDKRAISIYRVLEQLSMDGGKPRTEEVISMLDDDRLKIFILEKDAEGVFGSHVKETIQEKIRSIRIRVMSEERRELIGGLEKQVSVDPELEAARLQRIRQIDQDIMRIRQGKDGG